MQLEQGSANVPTYLQAISQSSVRGTRGDRYAEACWRSCLCRKLFSFWMPAPPPDLLGEAPEPRQGLRAGHIPGSKNLPFNQLLDDNGHFLDQDSLRKRFTEAGISPDAPVTTTCGSGVTACVLALGLSLLGNDDVTVYEMAHGVNGVPVTHRSSKALSGRLLKQKGDAEMRRLFIFERVAYALMIKDLAEEQLRPVILWITEESIWLILFNNLTFIHEDNAVCNFACANPISCVTTIMVIPSSASATIVSRTSLIISGSRAEVGSSNSINCGCIHSARAIATRCCWPPESCPDICVPVLES